MKKSILLFSFFFISTVSAQTYKGNVLKIQVLIRNR